MGAGWLVLLGLVASGPEIHGTLFLRYLYGQNARGTISAFQIPRTYLTVRGTAPFPEVPVRWTYRLTLDSRQVEDLGRVAYVKYAYLAVEAPGIEVRWGQIPTPWIHHAEKVWGLRAVAPVALDRWHVLSSADRGLSLALFRRAPVTLELAVVNGEGYRQAEPDPFKDGIAWLRLRGRGLALYGYVHRGRVNTHRWYRNRYAVAVALRSPQAGLWLEGVQAEDGSRDTLTVRRGVSVFGRWEGPGVPFHGLRAGVYLRYDAFGPSEEIAQWLVLGVFLRVPATPVHLVALSLETEGTSEYRLALVADLRF